MQLYDSKHVEHESVNKTVNATVNATVNKTGEDIRVDLGQILNNYIY